MKSNIVKIIFVLIILLMLFSINTEVHAWSGIVQEGSEFLKAGESSSEAEIGDVSKLKDLSGYLYNILLAAGVVIAVVVATILGIQFMIGGAEGQAKVKEMLIPFVVGCIIVFGGFGFWKIAVSIGNKVEDATSTSTTYSKDSEGRLYCDNCGDELISSEQHQGKCAQCGKYITGI